MADGRIIIDTKIDNSGAENGLGELSGMAKSGLKGVVGAVTAVSGALTGIMGSIGMLYNSQMEQYMASFETMLGSTEKAVAHVDDLKKFAASTPFEMGDLAQASKTLMAFGIEVEDIEPSLKMLGDISLGNKEKFNSLSLVFGQVASQGKLMGGDLMQMINAGFNPLLIISQQTGKSMTELKDEMSKGKITYEMVTEAMKTATSEGGMFAGAMEKQSKTMSGLISTLKDNLGALAGQVVEPLFNMVKSALERFLPFLEKISQATTVFFGELEQGQSIADAFYNAIAYVFGDEIVANVEKFMNVINLLVGSLVAVTAGMVAYKLAVIGSMIISKLTTLMNLYRNGTLLATAQQWLLNSALLSNPIALVAGLIAGLVGGIVYLWTTNEGFRNAIIGIWESIKSAGEACWGWLVKFFTEDIPNAFNTVMEWFGKLPEWFGELWAKVTEKFSEWGTNISNFFTETIPKWVEDIKVWFSQIPYNLGVMVGEFLATIYKWGSDTWTYFETNIPLWIEGISKWFSELPGKIWAWLVETYNNVVKWGADMWSKASEIASTFLTNIINWFRELPGRISTWLTSTIQKVIQFGSDMKAKAMEAGIKFVNGLIDKIKALPDQVREIGKNIVEGLWNGIVGMGSWIADKVSGFFGGIVDGAKKVLGIHSPSRVFRDQVGKYMAQGVGVGFENETENIQGDMKNNLSDLTAKMTATVNYETSKTSQGIVASSSNIIPSSESSSSDDLKDGDVVIIKNYMDSDEISEYTYKKVNGKLALATKKVR